MKRIKPYAIFESESIIRADIKYIIQELIDSNKVLIGYSDTNNFVIKTKYADKGLKWDDISEYVLRVVEYLGDRFVIAKVRRLPKYKEMGPHLYEIHINEDTYIDFAIFKITITWK